MTDSREQIDDRLAEFDRRFACKYEEWAPVWEQVMRMLRGVDGEEQNEGGTK